METETTGLRSNLRSILKSPSSMIKRIKNIGAHIIGVCFNICPTVQDYFSSIDEKNKESLAGEVQRVKTLQNKKAGQGKFTALIGKVPVGSQEGAVLYVAVFNRFTIRSWKIDERVFNDKNGNEVNKSIYSLGGTRMCNLIAEFDSETEDGTLNSGTYTLKQNLPGVYSNSKAYVHPHVQLDQSQTNVTVGYFTHLNVSLSAAKQIDLAFQAIDLLAPQLPSINMRIDGRKGAAIIRVTTALDDLSTVSSFMADKKKGGTLLLTQDNTIQAVFDREMALEMQAEKVASDKVREKTSSDKVILVVNKMAMPRTFRASQLVEYAGEIVCAREMHDRELAGIRSTEKAICLTIAGDTDTYADHIQNQISQRSGAFHKVIPQKALRQAFSLEVNDVRIAATSILSTDYKSPTERTNEMKLLTMRERAWRNRVKELNIPFAMEQWPLVSKAASINDWTGLNYSPEHIDQINDAHVTAYSLTELPEDAQRKPTEQTVTPQQSSAYVDTQLEAMNARLDAKLAEILSRMEAMASEFTAELSKINHGIKVLNLRTSEMEDHLTNVGNPKSSGKPGSHARKRQADSMGTYTRPANYTQEDLDVHADRLGKLAETSQDAPQINSTLTEEPETAHVEFSKGHVS